MPVYQRQCRACDYLEDRTEKITAPKVRKCPKCGKRKFAKNITKVNFVIKGASFKNGYYMPVSNEEMGLPPERELMKKLESEHALEHLAFNSDFTEEEKEQLTDIKKKENDEKRAKERRLKKLKEKHKEFSGKLDKAMKEAKKVDPDKRRRRANARKIKGELKTETIKEIIKPNESKN